MRHLVSRGLETSNFAPAIASTLGAPQGHPAAAQQVVRWDCVPPDDLCWAAAGWPGGAERWPSVCHSRLQSCTCTCTCTYVFYFGFVPGFVFSSRTFRDPSPCACLRDGTYSVPCNPRSIPLRKHASVRNMVLRGVGCCSQPSHAHCQCHSCAWDTVPVAAHAEAYRDARPRGVRVERPDIRNVCARGHRQANERNVVCERPW